MIKKYINAHRSYYVQDNVIISENDNKDIDIFFKVNELFRFHDQEFGITGFIKWTRNNEGTVFLSQCSFTERYNIKDYINDIIKRVKEL